MQQAVSWGEYMMGIVSACRLLTSSVPTHQLQPYPEMTQALASP